ncbi:MAG: acyl-CoA dehydratase activase-related protein, partial [Dehalococcoidales bacterium]|nr:acyl-CoA dehydratase activase-related protein [Dehalococcoidales bacterium]
MIRIGIPRALLYYEYYPMWQTFFEELGAEMVVSPPTTQTMLSSGSSRVVAETCLPVKVFMGHVLSLAKECDFIFIPAVRSTKKNTYNCSKFLGLPDMTRAVVPEAPPMLEIDIDINRGKHILYQAIYQLGRHFTWNPAKVRQASLAAWESYQHYREKMSHQKLTPPEAIESKEQS